MSARDGGAVLARPDRDRGAGRQRPYRQSLALGQRAGRRSVCKLRGMVRIAQPPRGADSRPPEHDARTEPAGWLFLVCVILLTVLACVA